MSHQTKHISSSLTHSGHRKRKLPSDYNDDLRPEILFGPGGSLDSQTTETQWYEAVTGSDGRFSEYLQDGTPLIESQKHAIEYAEEQRELQAMNTKAGTSPIKKEYDQLEHPLPPCPLDPTVQSLVDAKIKEIIGICTQRLEGDLQVVIARRDVAFRELAAEREWIRILELTLRQNEIPLPKHTFEKL